MTQTTTAQLDPATRIDLDLERAEDLLQQVLTDEALADVVPRLARAEILAAFGSIARARLLLEAVSEGLLSEPADA